MEHVTFLDHPKSRVTLVVHSQEHMELFLKLQNNPESRQYLGRYMPLIPWQEEEWLKKHANNEHNGAFTLVVKETKEAIGSMGLHGIDWKNRRATTGAAILEEHCNKGYGADAKMLLLSWAFLELGLHKVISFVLDTNLRSQAYSSKCGYKEVGRYKQHQFREGKWHDEVIMEVYAKEWRPLWKKFCKG
jgi:RimJ/RimL family protein N-acetyltransferase